MRTCTLIVLGFLTACGRAATPVSQPTPVRIHDARLLRVASCDDLVARLRARAIADMDARLDANLELATRSGGGIAVPESSGPVAAPAPSTPTAGGGAASDAAAQWSDTNVQVAGVDEPDFVKTDGKYVYVVADGRFQVLDAWPAAATRRVGAVAIDGTPTKLLLAGTRAVVFSSLEGSVWGDPGPPVGGGGVGVAVPMPVPPGGSMAMPMPWLGGGGTGECTYGYDCVPQGDGRPLQVTVLDLADRTAPRVVRRATFSGSLLAARRIGDAVHAVVTFPERPIAGIQDWPEIAKTSPSEAEIRAAFGALRAKNRAIIAAADLLATLPSARDERGGAATDALPGACEGFHASEAGGGNGFLSLVSFSLAADAPLAATTVVGRPGFVYAGLESLYVASPLADVPYRWTPEPAQEWTAIHGFRLEDAGAAEYAGSGSVLGRPLSQFALDEHEGALRVATTAGHSPDPRAYNLVTVLRPEDGKLVEAGRVDGIAKGEDIRSVRFDGKRGFVVTFKKTDPLFVLDLADPAAPRIAGELKVPGFSTYMQLLDDGHLLTIGYDADDQGGFAWFRGIQLQIFDVRDPASPALAGKEVIGTRGSSSAAATNHLAFTWFAPKELLAIPMTRCEGGEAWQPGRMTFSGLMVYRVTPAAGFSYVGGVAHQSPEPPSVHDGACGSWWTQPNTLVERSLFLEDYVYSFTRGELRVQDTRAMGTDVATVRLTP